MLKNTFTAAKKYGAQVVAVGSLALATTTNVLAAASASATEAVAGVTSAKDDMVTVFGAILTMAIVVWGIYKIVKIFGSK